MTDQEILDILGREENEGVGVLEIPDDQSIKRHIHYISLGRFDENFILEKGIRSATVDVAELTSTCAGVAQCMGSPDDDECVV